MFMMVKEAAFNLKLVWISTPSSVLSNFEQALINALQLNFPTAEHRDCYYHYSQAIWQKVQDLGLQELYRSEDGILKSFVQKHTCFVPLPPPPPQFCSSSTDDGKSWANHIQIFSRLLMPSRRSKPQQK